MTEPATYGRSVPAPTCDCGAPSEWLTGRGRWCHRCLPARAAFWVARSWISRRIDAAFAEVRL